jgi:predicted dehydrogenase
MIVVNLSEYSAGKRRLRLGLVGGGTGLIGAIHANGARLSNRWEVVAGALSSNPKTAKSAGQQWHFDLDRCYLDYAKMAKAEAARPDGIDAVAIVTPNHLHAPVALEFMRQGIDIICDKPVTAQLEKVDKLTAEQKKTGVFFGVTYAYASHPMIRQAREMVLSGDLGDIRQVHVEYFQDWAIDLTDEQANAPWRLDSEKSGPSFTVADIGTHAEHLASFVTGRQIEAVRADFHVTGSPKPLEDTAFMHIRLEGGVPGTLMVSQSMAGSHCGLQLRVSGTKATIEWLQEKPEFMSFRRVGEPEKILSRGHGAGIYPSAEQLVRMPRGHPEALSDAWANLYQEFSISIQARREGEVVPEGLIEPPTLVHGLQGMKFINAAVKSSKEDRWVNL